MQNFMVSYSWLWHLNSKTMTLLAYIFMRMNRRGIFQLIYLIVVFYEALQDRAIGSGGPLIAPLVFPEEVTQQTCLELIFLINRIY